MGQLVTHRCRGASRPKVFILEGNATDCILQARVRFSTMVSDANGRQTSALRNEREKGKEKERDRIHTRWIFAKRTGYSHGSTFEKVKEQHYARRRRRWVPLPRYASVIPSYLSFPPRVKLLHDVSILPSLPSLSLFLCRWSRGILSRRGP